MLAVGAAAGSLAVALNHMHRYEPQALRLLSDGRLAADLADDKTWLGARQGLFATMAVSALPPDPSRPDLERLLWAPLNRPLRAWPEPALFAASGAVDEFPAGPLPAALADYDRLVSTVLERTLLKIDEKGLGGLMTFGVYPRYWGGTILGDELDCGGDDPTPAETWDDLYWCATWTDYHNTIATAPIWAMRTGEVAWLDELAFPGALRTLHTQIMQCADGDGYFYCGQAPAGYGGYRLDFNSSHAYFDNLFLYYWLTGDYTVVETLERGAASMRDYLCSRRPASPASPTILRPTSGPGSAAASPRSGSPSSVSWGWPGMTPATWMTTDRDWPGPSLSTTSRQSGTVSATVSGWRPATPSTAPGPIPPISSGWPPSTT